MTPTLTLQKMCFSVPQKPIVIVFFRFNALPLFPVAQIVRQLNRWVVQYSSCPKAQFSLLSLSTSVRSNSIYRCLMLRTCSGKPLSPMRTGSQERVGLASQVFIEAQRETRRLVRSARQLSHRLPSLPDNQFSQPERNAEREGGGQPVKNKHHCKYNPHLHVFIFPFVL